MFQIIENTGNDCICWSLNNLQQLNHSVNNSVIWNYILLITLTGGFIYTWYELRVMRKRINTLEGKKNVPLIIGLKCVYYELINKIKK